MHTILHQHPFNFIISVFTAEIPFSLTFPPQSLQLYCVSCGHGPYPFHSMHSKAPASSSVCCMSGCMLIIKCQAHFKDYPSMVHLAFISLEAGYKPAYPQSSTTSPDLPLPILLSGPEDLHLSEPFLMGKMKSLVTPNWDSTLDWMPNFITPAQISTFLYETERHLIFFFTEDPKVT